MIYRAIAWWLRAPVDKKTAVALVLTIWIAAALASIAAPPHP